MALSLEKVQMPATRKSPGKFWCGTWNNYNDESISTLCGPRREELCSYMVFQKEISDSGTPHLQIYLELQNRKTLRSLKRKWLGDRIHLEKRRGTALEASDYCRKVDTRVEDSIPTVWGTISDPKPGRRTDLQHVADMIKAGKTMKDIAEDSPVMVVKYHRGLEKLMQILATPRNWMTEMIVYHGPTLCGKSYDARTAYPDAYWKPKDDGQAWFDGYMGQEVMIVDEFYSWMSWGLILRLCDENPLLVPTKGGFVNFAAKKIIFTSNDHPFNWYSKLQRDKTPLYRRIKECWRYESRGVRFLEPLEF